MISDSVCSFRFNAFYAFPLPSPEAMPVAINCVSVISAERGKAATVRVSGVFASALSFTALTTASIAAMSEL